MREQNMSRIMQSALKRWKHTPRLVLFVGAFGLISACATSQEARFEPAIERPDITASTRVIPTLPPFASSGHEAFDAWRTDFADRAVKQGHAPVIVYNMLRDLKPLSIYLSEDNNQSGVSSQAEFAKPIWEYLRTAVSETRKTTGKDRALSEAALFDRIEESYGVDRSVVVAIWGMETGFGANIGNFDGPETLANMAVEGRRRALAERELLATMKIVEQELASRDQLVSGWAGAMGQTQFMPSTFLQYGVDFTGDGKRDLWTSRADALASAANYLKASGYVSNLPWGLEVIAPAEFDYALADGTRRSVAEWAALGVTPIRNGSLQELSGGSDPLARLWLPAGATGPKYLLYKNFDVFLTYNRSNAYALAVGLLADAVDGHRGPIAPWPREMALLSVEEIKTLQAGLNALGFEAGAVDGIAGNGTRAALQRFQSSRGLRADGYPTQEALSYVRSEATG